MSAYGAVTTWGMGEYARMAARLDVVAARVVELVAPRAGEVMLDVACGTGNAALHAARRGATTIGIDFEPRLLAEATERANAEHLGVAWRVGDAAALPVDDRTINVVVSVFGVMYAPDQARAASELARVCAPGARLGIAAWLPGSLMPAMGAALAPYIPPPPLGSPSPASWGDEQVVAELLERAGLAVKALERQVLDFEFADRDEAVTFLLETAGHVRAERNRLVAEGHWESLRADLGALVDARSLPRAGGGGISLPAEHLVVLAGAHAG